MCYKVKAGRVVGGVEVRVVAEDGTLLPNDGKSVGEFEIRGPWMTGSYYKDEDPARFHDGWLCTGDVGTLDSQGYMTISDRTKDVIKSGGEWISSVELENAVMAHPDVFEAAVCGARRSGPSARWWPSSPSPAAAALPDLVSFLSDHVPRWWLPEQSTLITEVPKTSVGKFDRRSCGVHSPTVTTRCRARHCPSERPERGHGGHGRAPRGDGRGADRHGHRRPAARQLR